MAYKGVIDDIKLATSLKKPYRLPFFACSEEFDVKWYGKYSYEEVCQDGNKMAEVWSAAIKEFDYDWGWLQIDDCFEFEPLGVGCFGRDNILRATRNYLPATLDTIRKLPRLDPEKDGRMPEKLKALQKLRNEFGDTVLVMGSLAAPYSALGLLWGLEQSMMVAMTDPPLLKRGCDYFVESQYRYAIAQYRAGAHALWLGDCNAFSGILSVDQYMEFAFEPCKRLVGMIKSDTDMIIHLHNSEVRVPNLLKQAELGVDIVNVGPAADIIAVRKAMTGKCCFTGNLDPIEMLMRGAPQDVANDAIRIAGLCYESGGYIFNTGEMNPREIPVENMRALSLALKRFNTGCAK